LLDFTRGFDEMRRDIEREMENMLKNISQAINKHL
jgi:hypothetical protein